MTERPNRDAVLDRLHDLEDGLRAELSGRAEVERRPLVGTAYQEIRFTPVNTAAVPVTWLESVGTELLLFAGPGALWELDWSDVDVDFVEQVVRAAVEGRIHAVTAPGRATAYLSQTDGSTNHSSVYDGCLAGLVTLPGWRTWGRKIRYEPY